eukprot:309171-Prymnesium_polylepis.1
MERVVPILLVHLAKFAQRALAVQFLAEDQLLVVCLVDCERRVSAVCQLFEVGVGLDERHPALPGAQHFPFRRRILRLGRGTAAALADDGDHACSGSDFGQIGPAVSAAV